MLNYNEPQSQFNVAIANAEYVHNLRINIVKALVDKNYDLAIDLLRSMNTELHGWYHKNKKLTEIKVLLGYEEKIGKLSTLKNAMLVRQICNSWFREAVAHAYRVWFSKETDSATTALQRG